MADPRDDLQETQKTSDETESRSIEAPKDKEDSVLRINESGPSCDYKHSNAENLQQYRRQRDCRYNHPTQLPQDLPERICVPICKYFLKGHCKFGSVCKFQHIKDRNVAEPMYQEVGMNCINARENLQKPRQGNIERQRRDAQENLQQQRFQDMPEDHNVDAQQNLQEQRKRNIEKERREARLRLEQIRPTVVFDEWSQARELMIEFGFTDFEGSFLGRNRYSMMHHTPQQQQSAQTPQQHQSLASHFNLYPFHHQQQQHMETSEAMIQHTPQQQQSVQTPQQHQSLASHPSVEKLTDAIEAGTPDQNSHALVTELNSHFDKCQQLLNSISKSLGSKTNEVTELNSHFDKCRQLLSSISRSLGSKTNEYVDGQKRNLEESEQLLQQRKELIEEYKKSVEEIVKLSSKYFS